MIHAKLLATLALLTFSGQAVKVSAAEPYTFKYINNALGLADRQGRVARWMDADEKINVDDDLQLPVRFQFNSDQQFVTNGCLGQGRWFPILESTVIRREDRWLMRGPGGFTYYFNIRKTEFDAMRAWTKQCLERQIQTEHSKWMTRRRVGSFTTTTAGYRKR
jgi:hypothetical protein